MQKAPQNISHVNQKMNWFQKFLLVCSGGNIHILRKTPSEWNKFAGIGGIVLFTAIFATLSAGYAMFTIFENLWISAGFAVLWGLMIFNLDRYIVSSIKKTGTWWNQALMSIPRLILATFLGIIILLIGYVVLEKLTPEKTWQEIVQNKNVALAIIFGAFILGISFIIGMAIHG